MTAIAQPALVLAVGLATPVGLDADAAAAAVRGGVSRVRESSVYDRHFSPHRLSLVPEDALPPLAAPLEAAPVTSAHARMLRLAGIALQQVAGSTTAPLVIGLPEARPGEPDAVGKTFLDDLHVQAQGGFDRARSAARREGGAAGLFALADALALLAGGKAEVALVAGADTFLDLRRLAVLDAEGRILGDRVMDGFIPGEGAAALLLATPAHVKKTGARPVARILAAATGTEPGHRYSSSPYKGDGLANTFQELFAAAGSCPPVQCVYAGFNGESLPAKEWGVSHLRNGKRFSPDLQFEHPADCLGDTGAASGPIMLGLAALALREGHRRPPCLVWCTSDREPRAAALLDTL